MKMLADQSHGASLADLGYRDAGIDDGWQKCGSYGPENYRYHSASGDPVVDTRKFPDLPRLTSLAHAIGLTAGWYGNACGCAAQPYPQCCSDHCDTIECFAGDVNATLSLGFDSYKIDGCGAQRDIELWAELFNHSISVRREELALSGMMIENCHDGDQPAPGANEPYYDDHGELWCPFHTYRTSGDARPTYGSMLGNLNSTLRLAAANLSVPGCWAYADMMEVGVTATGGVNDCGPEADAPCPPMNATEARTHFGAWAIISSPLVLGFDLRDSEQLERHWDAISNVDAIEVNQDYAGFSGTRFMSSDDLTSFEACDWKPNVTCAWPTLMGFYKPLSGRDKRRSTMAVLLMNNGVSAHPVDFAWNDVPGMANSTTACEVYDVWARKSLGRVEGKGFTTATELPPRDSAFLTLSACEHAAYAH